MTDTTTKLNSGLAYEQKIYSTVKEANLMNSYISVIGDEPKGGFNRHDTDMKLELKGKPFDLEIKANLTAQMGGTSFKYDMPTQTFASVKPIPKSDEDFISEAISGVKSDLDNFISYIQQCEPISYNSKNVGFPMNTTKDSWKQAQTNDLLKPINVKVNTSTEWMHEHYAKKGVYYIQIGKGGFFYLKDNPLDLPIPQLEGNLNLEIRLGRGGSKPRLYEGIMHRFAGAGIRIQGRLNFKGKSPYTLDSVDSINELITTIEDK